MKLSDSLKGVAILLLFMVAIAATLVTLMARNTSVLQSHMLCSLQNGQQTFSFRCPKGFDFSMVVGVPSNSNPPLQISGAISLKSGPKPATNLSFDTTDSVKGNWLASHNLDSYAATLRVGTNAVRLDSYLSNGARVDVHLNLPTNLASGSLWLCYVTKWKDVKQP